MIIEITKNKLTKELSNDDILNQFRIHFVFNPEIWYSGKELEMYVGTSNQRKYINKLRCEGLPIISSRKGYKLTQNKDEIKKCYENLRNRALRTLTSAKMMKKHF